MSSSNPPLTCPHDHALGAGHEFPAQARTLAEQRYRRGYQQGMMEAVRMLEQGCSVAQLRDWCEGKVYDWRFRKHRGRVQLPPVWRK